MPSGHVSTTLAHLSRGKVPSVEAVKESVKQDLEFSLIIDCFILHQLGTVANKKIAIDLFPAALFSVLIPERERPVPGGRRARPPRHVLGDGRRRLHGQRAAVVAEAGFAPTRLTSAPHAAASAPSSSLRQGQGAARHHGATTGGLRGDRRTEGVWWLILGGQLSP